MPLFTMIFHLTPQSTNTILVESLDMDKNQENYEHMRRTCKEIFKNIRENQVKGSGIMQADSSYFIYLIDRDICYVCYAKDYYPPKLALCFLDDLKEEFTTQFGSSLDDSKWLREYSMQNFDSYIQLTKKSYSDSKSQRNLNKISADLQDLNSLMKQNVRDLIDRDGKLRNIATRAGDIANMAGNYENKTGELLRMHFWRTYGLYLIIFGIFVLLLLIKFWWF
eukprot:TRINITY_DN13096_c0_g1_i1.p1 TRINITY_DN13096_c0_g1~~TRINITY_DN13096_c0_g1_i1.p1  ORF type:complete len:223 (+),score=37.69 TRINITY_DN13096_c0_g1_i1:29-697(+)